MFRKKRKHRMPSLNTTSTADISFMLLIFFLITTSIDNNTGMMRRLPPPPEEKEATELVVKKRNVMSLVIDTDGNMTCNGKVVRINELEKEIIAFVDNIENIDTLPEKTETDIPLLGMCSASDKHVISISVDANTTYDDYFKAYNTIVGAYGKLRNKLANQHFGCNYAECSPAQREAIASCYPQRISDADIEEEGGGK